MVTELGFKNAYVSQRAIYDERYRVGRYDHRSAVRVLTAERNAMRHAMDRALKSNRRVRRINLFDFGYGTGRVTNEFIGSYVHDYAASKKDLCVVAYDVSSAGLMKSKEALCSRYGFRPDGPMNGSQMIALVTSRVAYPKGKPVLRSRSSSSTDMKVSTLR